MRNPLRALWKGSTDSGRYLKGERETFEKKAVDTRQEEKPSVPTFRNGAKIADSLLDLDGGYGFGSYYKDMKQEKEIIPLLSNPEMIFYTFHDADGVATPKRYVGLDVAPHPETKKMSAVLPVDEGQALFLELQPGEKVLDREGQEIYASPWAALEEKNDLALEA